MRWNPAESPKELQAALDTHDDHRVRELLDALVEHIQTRDQSYECDAAASVLNSLRGAREFGHLQKVAATLIECGQRAPVVQRHYAQALIEENRLFDAERHLEALGLEAAELGDEREQREARGLLGRVFKQRYVAGRAAERARPDDLRRAVRFYLETYDAARDANLWHGINAVALLKRAEADGIAIDNAPAAEPIAQQILAEIQRRFDTGRADAWDKATAMEANVALGRAGDALTWLMRYVNDIAAESDGLECADAFKFESTRRQLHQVWRLDRSREPGSLLIPPLESALLRARDGSLRRDPADVRAEREPGQFEARHGLDAWYPLQWLRTGDRRAERVTRISRRDTDMTKGTGFVIPGDDLDARFRGEVVLLTNSHVISGLREVHEGGKHSPLRLDQAAAHLDVLNRKLQWRAILWESPPEDEDTTVIALDDAKDIASDPYPVFSRPLPVGGTGRIFIIGYPEASTQIRVSFENNQLLEMNDKYLRYRTPTEQGSSGSPLFDSDWQLVGIHHYSSPDLDSFQTPGRKLAANQGVWIRRIQRAIAG